MRKFRRLPHETFYLKSSSCFSCEFRLHPCAKKFGEYLFGVNRLQAVVAKNQIIQCDISYQHLPQNEWYTYYNILCGDADFEKMYFAGRMHCSYNVGMLVTIMH